ncbi:hypothetical protein [Gynuella sunshinyii]|uniref:Uncharacterized protein n=1 Tax=Gynuella sunshinyii YC6258 TaxID=1445510 RepID=A0A0C5UY44_9GAMM|nr:hypothetical protein [Gynuella sunshinyii]AJQ92205.1 hypothetical Protein YC6258_00153 [Gynuella sunshinyii YC6258]
MRLLKTLLAAVIIFSLISSFAYFTMIESKILTQYSEVKKASRVVLLSKTRSKFVTGEYWENEMLAQYKKINGLPLDAQFDYFRILLANIEFYGTQSYDFIHMVGMNAEKFANYLDDFEKDDSYLKLSRDEQEILKKWKAEFQVIGQDKELLVD